MRLNKHRDRQEISRQLERSSIKNDELADMRVCAKRKRGITDVGAGTKKHFRGGKKL
jgi:hypothetical protein